MSSKNSNVNETKKRDVKYNDKSISKQNKIQSNVPEVDNLNLIGQHSSSDTPTETGFGDNLLQPLRSNEDDFQGDLKTIFQPLNTQATRGEKSEDPYFRSYESLHIHRKMIQDKPRTDAYKQAIEANKDLFKGKTILDVGAGTGILSIFAARAGAKHVYAVEFSDMAQMAVQIISENNLSNKITVVQKKIEDCIFKKDIPQVDIIISEWMGYCLLYEGMLDSVLFARDNFLNEGGLIFPNKARIFIAAIDDINYKDHNDKFWTENEYGISMKCAKKAIENFVFVDFIKPDQIISTSAKIFEVDINTCSKEDLEFSNQYSLHVLNFGDNQPLNFTAFVMWFEVEFYYGSNNQIILSTSPNKPFTHWRHQVLYMQGDENQRITLNQGDEIEGSIALRKPPHNARDVEFKLSINLSDYERKLFYYFFS